jgi:bifunctional isochorismate lyase / aryl carrier protein
MTEPETAENPTAAEATADRTAGIERLRADVARALEEPPASLTDDEDLFERGLDSLRLMSLVEGWRAAGADVGFVDLVDTPTLQAWSRLVDLGPAGSTEDGA